MSPPPGADSLPFHPQAGSRPLAGFDHERSLQRAGFRCIAGVDEAGRGTLAGPVVAAAVVLDPRRIPGGLADSKLLSAARREALFIEILGQCACAWASIPAQEIDRTNIRKASLRAMRLAVEALPAPADHALIDGRDVPLGLGIPALAIIKGDRISASIAAASIVAKVMRDRMMDQADIWQPHYGFGRHAGYPTKAHLDALTRHGACDLHRRSFAPVRAICGK
jgi:ribonuclease HII